MESVWKVCARRVTVGACAVMQIVTLDSCGACVVKREEKRQSPLLPCRVLMRAVLGSWG